MNRTQYYIVKDAKYILHEFENRMSNFKVTKLEVKEKGDDVFVNWTSRSGSSSSSYIITRKASICIGKKGSLAYYDVLDERYKRSASLLDAINNAEM